MRGEACCSSFRQGYSVGGIGDGGGMPCALVVVCLYGSC